MLEQIPDFAPTMTTPKGTELPLLNLSGKPYLQVAHRLVWFREECPTWSIQTKILEYKDEARTATETPAYGDIPKSITVTEAKRFAIIQAQIFNDQGVCIAMATKREQYAESMKDKTGFPDYLEKAETGAIGRALAIAGYGTQFATQELDEGQRLADAPVTIPKTPLDAIQAKPIAGAVAQSPTPALKRTVSENVKDVFPNAA